MELNLIMCVCKVRYYLEMIDVCVLSALVTEGAELNTTLALRAELEEVQSQVFDPEKAVKEKLQSSRFTEKHISSKAAEGETPQQSLTHH